MKCNRERLDLRKKHVVQEPLHELDGDAGVGNNLLGTGQSIVGVHESDLIEVDIEASRLLLDHAGDFGSLLLIVEVLLQSFLELVSEFWYSIGSKGESN